MNRTAYLVVHLDTTDDELPEIRGAGIYSEPAKSLTGACGPGAWAFDVTEMEGTSFEDARDNLKNALLMTPSVFGWVTQLLKAGGQW